MEVEQWLRSLPLAPKSKVSLSSLLHLLFQHGRLWEITGVNPIDLVRQRGGRGRYREFSAHGRFA